MDKTHCVSMFSPDGSSGAPSGGVPFGERGRSLLDRFRETFGDVSGAAFFSSPGRIEIVGNHTDHNDGRVLTAAVNLDKLACVSPREDGKAVIVSAGYPDVVADVLSPSRSEGDAGGSAALVKGVASYFLRNGRLTGGFSAVLDSAFPAGAGVSSSASFEVLAAEIFNNLYNGGKIPPMFLAKAARHAENVWFGKPCGLMDQAAVALGGVSLIDFFSQESPSVRTLDFPFDLSIVITDTGGDHSSLTSAYASIRSDMEAVAALYGKKTLRGVDPERFLRDIPGTSAKAGGGAVLRALHYFEENVRVDRAAAALENGDLDAFVSAVRESGLSSLTLLRNCSVDGDRDLRIPLALAVSERQSGVLACRVHGGGFAGTVLAFVERERAEDYVRTMSGLFGKGNVYVMKIRKRGACRAAEIHG